MVPGAHPLSAFIAAPSAPQSGGGQLRLQMPMPLQVPLTAATPGHYQTLMTPSPAGGVSPFQMMPSAASPFQMQMQLPTPNATTFFQPILTAAGNAFQSAHFQQPFNTRSVRPPMNASGCVPVTAVGGAQLQTRALEWHREDPRPQVNMIVTSREVPSDPTRIRSQGDPNRCLSRCRKDASTWL